MGVVKVVSEPTFADSVRRDRAVVLSAIITLTALAWIYTAYLAGNANQMSASMAMPNLERWGVADFTFMLIMWVVMMVAMMLPSTTPMLLLFGRIGAKRKSEQRPFAPNIAFLAGYLFVWVGFCLFATVFNWGLHTGDKLSSMMGHTPPTVGGAILVAAGVFQWTPLKEACLQHCRSPIGFLMAHWREGTVGAMRMGLHHGTYCLGCCWMLMVLLFVLGVMNLPWVAVLTVIILAEKVLPGGVWLSRILGGLLVLWGGWLIVVG
jgi:predicted metal-binding membrane protein